MNFKEFRGPFYDDVIYKDYFYLSEEKIKIKAQNLRLALVTF